MKIVKYSLALAFLGGFFVAPVYANSAAVSLFSAFERKVFSLPSVLPPSNFVLTSNIEGQITKQITKQVLEGASQSNNAVILPVTGFLNAPWQQRMFLEYETLSLRHTKLQQMLERWEAGTLEATPRSPIKLLQYQSNLMAEYLRILEKRAEIEEIPLVYENLKT